MAVFTAAATLGASILGALGATTSFFAVNAVVGFLAQAALGIALNALTPKPKTQGANRGYQVNTKGSALDHQIIYGRVRTGGVIVYDETGEVGNDESDERLFRVIAFAGHEIEGYDEFYVDGEIVTFKPLTISSQRRPIETSRYIASNGSSRIAIDDRALGTSNQIAFPRLVDVDPNWTTDHRLRGIAAIYVELLYNADIFPTGVPEFTVTIKGKKVYDPREVSHDIDDPSTWEWSDNPALCIADYLRSGYGLGEDTSNIDYDLVETAADVCDELAIDGNKRYTCNGAFTTSVTPYDIMNDLLTSMGGLLWYAQGKWRMKAAHYVAPTITFDEDDLRSSIAVKTRHSRRDNFNTVRGTFRGEESDWQVTDYPEVSNSAFLAADNGQESVLDLDLPFTDNSVEARRIARIALERNRQQLTVSASFGLRAFQVQVGDIIKLSLERFGWVEKEFEVNSWTFGLTEGQDIQVQMTLREISESVFDEVDDGIVYERDNTTLNDPFLTSADPTNLTATISRTINEDGTYVGSFIVAWDESTSPFLREYSLEWKLSGNSTYNSTTVRTNSFEIYPVIENVEYDIRVKAINVAGVSSNYVATTKTLVKDDSIPNAPSNLTTEVGPKTVKLSWDAPTQNTDATPARDIFQYEVYRATSTNPIVPIARISGTSFTDSGLDGNVTYYYRVKALDFSGNESAYSANASALTEEAGGGASLVQVPIYKRDTSAPSAPTGGTFDFGTQTLTPPSGWSTDDPGGTDTLYVSQFLFVRDTSDPSDPVVTAGSWSTPIPFAGDVTDGQSLITLSIYQRSSTNTGTPSGGSYDFGTQTLNSVPSGWSTTIPAGTSPVWISQALAAAPAGGVDSSLTWTNPVVIARDGEKGDDGATGQSVYTAIVFKREQIGSTPQAPFGGDMDFGTNTLTPPTDWFLNPPSGGGVLWGTRQVFAIIGDTGTDNGGQWSPPFKVSEDGADGLNGLSTFLASIYRRSSSSLSTPSGGDYDFGANSLSPPSGWSDTVPSGTDPVYISTALASVQGTTGTDNNLNWSSPTILSKNGDNGADGISTYQVTVFKRDAFQPIDPVGGSYNFGTQSLIPPSGWSATTPTGTDPLWVSSAVASIQGTTGTYSFGSTWSEPVAQSRNGDDGATGDTVVTGRVYYQTLQSSAPSTPTGSGYNVSTGTFSTLSAGWDEDQPDVDATDTSVQEWSSRFTVTIDGVTSAQTISFASPTGAIQFATTIESDNFVTGSSGWQIERDTGNAEFGAATIRGTLTASQIQIDNVTIDSDGSGNLIIKSGGVDTDEIALNGVTIASTTIRTGSSSPAGGVVTSSNSRTVGSTTVSTEGGDVRVQYEFVVEKSGANASGLSFQIFRNGSTNVRGILSVELPDNKHTVVQVVTVDDPGSGSNTYTLEVSYFGTSGDTYTIRDTSTFILETKR